MKTKLGISKTKFKNLIVQISKEIGCSGYIREYSWRPIQGEWNGSIHTYIDDAVEFYDPNEPVLNVHYWHRPAPNEEPDSMYRVVTFGNIQDIIKNGYDIYFNKLLGWRDVKPKKESSS